MSELAVENNVIAIGNDNQNEEEDVDDIDIDEDENQQEHQNEQQQHQEEGGEEEDVEQVDSIAVDNKSSSNNSQQQTENIENQQKIQKKNGDDEIEIQSNANGNEVVTTLVAQSTNAIEFENNQSQQSSKNGMEMEKSEQRQMNSLKKEEEEEHGNTTSNSTSQIPSTTTTKTTTSNSKEDEALDVDIEDMDDDMMDGQQHKQVVVKEVVVEVPKVQITQSSANVPAIPTTTTTPVTTTTSTSAMQPFSKENAFLENLASESQLALKTQQQQIPNSSPMLRSSNANLAIPTTSIVAPVISNLEQTRRVISTENLSLKPTETTTTNTNTMPNPSVQISVFAPSPSLTSKTTATGTLTEAPLTASQTPAVQRHHSQESASLAGDVQREDQLAEAALVWNSMKNFRKNDLPFVPQEKPKIVPILTNNSFSFLQTQQRQTVKEVFRQSSTAILNVIDECRREEGVLLLHAIAKRYNIEISIQSSNLHADGVQQQHQNQNTSKKRTLEESSSEMPPSKKFALNA